MGGLPVRWLFNAVGNWIMRETEGLSRPVG